jgi:ADP-heptose:LPS heptosyltransferase
MKRLTLLFINWLRKKKHASHAALLLLIDACVAGIRAKKNNSGKQNILLVKLDRIGDFLLWLDAAREIRNLYPGSKYNLTLLGNALWTELAEQMPLFDQVWNLDRKKFKNDIVYRLGQLRKIRKAGFDIIINPVFSREIIFGDSVAKWSGAKHKIGFQGDCSNIEPWQKLISDGWYTKLIPASDQTLMELERNAEFIRGLGAVDARAAVPRLELSSCSGNFSKDSYIILFPSASEPIREWPAENFVNVARKIREDLGCSIIVSGGRDDYRVGRLIEDALDFSIINKVGKTSLIELSSLIAGARMLVGNETGAIHMAAALSTPSVCITGGGHYGRFVPYVVETQQPKQLPVVVTRKKDCFGCNWKCVHTSLKKSAPCINEVTVDEVWNAILSLFHR